MQENPNGSDGAAPLPPPPPGPGWPAAGSDLAPYLPSVPPPQLDTSFDRAGLLARRQMLVIAAIANGVGGALLGLGVLGSDAGLLLGLAVGVWLAVGAYRVARMLYGVGAAVACAVGAFVPFVWIGVVIFLATQASARLRRPAAGTGWR